MKVTKKTQAEAIRELMLAVNCLDSICEEVEGKRRDDNESLIFATVLASRVRDKYKSFVSDYPSKLFSDDTRALPEKFNVRIEDIQARRRTRRT